jgi:hypothetical protein
MRRTWGWLLIALLAMQGALIAPVRAADAIGNVLALVAKVQQSNTKGFEGLRSYRMRIRTPHLSGVMISNIEKNKDEFIFMQNNLKYTVYTVGSIWYQQTGKGAWTKMDMARLLAWTRKVNSKPIAAATDEPLPHERVLADRKVNGVLMSAANFEVPAKSIDSHLSSTRRVTVTCLFDKRDPRNGSCRAGELLTLIFDRADDPANDFTIPIAALRAPLTRF